MATLSAIAPFFIVASINTSVSFYVDKLGFEVEYLGPAEGSFFAIVGRDNISIFLKEISAAVLPMPNHTRHRWARWDAYIYTPDPDELFRELVARSAPIDEPLQDTDDGQRGFAVRDADGYVLFLGRPREG
jgi:catechol 2,3-dioxygenase-like lactoylglutathione lyase family enzyme